MKKYNVLKIIIIILMLLCIVTVITYAYFSEIIQTNGQINSRISMPNGAYSFTSSNSEIDGDPNSRYQIVLHINQKNMTMAAVNNQPASSNSTYFEVFLESKMNGVPIVCTYDVDIRLYDIRSLSNIELPYIENGVIYNHEFSIVANQTSTGVIKTLEMEDDILPETEVVDLKQKNSLSLENVIYDNAVIGNSVNGTTAKTQWTVTLNYYNLPVVQTFQYVSGRIYLQNINCQNMKPRVIYKNESVDNVGTEVMLGNEHFYVIGSNETDVTLLSKYNLKVGAKDTNNINTLYTSTDKGFNMQCRDCLGYVSDVSSIKSGTIAYSNNSNLNYNNSLVKSYVDAYINNIRTYYNIDIKSSRLITLDELTNLGCINSSCNVAGVNDLSRSWLYSSSYWVDDYSGSNVYTVRSDGVINTNNYSTNNVAGIRPVIVVSKADFATLEDEDYK